MAKPVLWLALPDGHRFLLYKKGKRFKFDSSFAPPFLANKTFKNASEIFAAVRVFLKKKNRKTTQ